MDSRPSHNRKLSATNGFSLIELVFVMAIIAILAMLVYPSYLDQVRKSKRAVAKGMLLNAANREEQFFFNNRAYTGNLTDLGYSSDPISFGGDHQPTSSASDALYQLSVLSVDDTSCGGTPCFQLQAVPQNDQTNDACGTFTITSSDARRVTNTTGTKADACW